MPSSLLGTLSIVLGLLPTAATVLAFCRHSDGYSREVPSIATRSPLVCFHGYRGGRGSWPASGGGRSVVRHRVTGRGTTGAGALLAALEVGLADRVEAGCVLVAGEGNYGHMTQKAVALVYEHADGQATRAVCLDKGLAFTIGEMVGGDPAALGLLADNRLFRGGDEGSNAIVVHDRDLQGARALGETGLFVGGLAAAVQIVDEGGAEPQDFKFFFNYLSWPDGALEQQVQKGLWRVVTLPKGIVLDARQTRDMELWGRVAFALKSRA